MKLATAITVAFIGLAGVAGAANTSGDVVTPIQHGKQVAHTNRLAHCTNPSAKLSRECTRSSVHQQH